MSMAYGSQTCSAPQPAIEKGFFIWDSFMDDFGFMRQLSYHRCPKALPTGVSETLAGAAAVLPSAVPQMLREKLARILGLWKNCSKQMGSSRQIWAERSLMECLSQRLLTGHIKSPCVVQLKEQLPLGRISRVGD